MRKTICIYCQVKQIQPEKISNNFQQDLPTTYPFFCPQCSISLFHFQLFIPHLGESGMTNGRLWSAHSWSSMLFLSQNTFPFVQNGLFTICREIPSLVPGTHPPFYLPCCLQSISHSFLFSPLLLVQNFLPFFKIHFPEVLPSWQLGTILLHSRAIGASCVQHEAAPASPQRSLQPPLTAPGLLHPAHLQI